MRDNEQVKEGFIRLVQIMDRLIAPDGCPWDQVQTPQTLKNYLLEEAYELVDAVESGDAKHSCEEAGDLLFVIVFLARLYEGQEAFDITHVMDSIATKMIRRHPHVFGPTKVANAAEVRERWHKIKQHEAKTKGEETFSFISVPRALPALLRAQRIGARAGHVGFDWSSADGVWDKLDEELGELREACREHDPARMKDELGDVLFTLVNLSRHLRINAEEALRQTVNRFVERFDRMKALLEQEGRPLEEFSLDEMNSAWERCKE